MHDHVAELQSLLRAPSRCCRGAGTPPQRLGVDPERPEPDALARGEQPTGSFSVPEFVLGFLGVVGGKEFCQPLFVPSESAGLEVVDHGVEP